MKKKFFLIILAIIILLAAGLAIYFFIIKNSNQQLNNLESSLINKNQSHENKELEAEYEKELRGILKDFSTPQSSIDKIIGEVLKLSVPYKYKDLHLNLVIALNKIQAGRVESDQAKIEEGIAEIENLKKDYSFLPDVLKNELK